MNENTYEIETLALKYCEGTATPQEIAKVEEWMAESDNHYQQVRQMYLMLLATDTQQVSDSFETEKILLEVHRKMQDGKNKPMFTMKRGWNLFQRWAAILFIPVTISLLVLFSQRGLDDASLVTISTNPGMISMFRLPDSTLVYLNADSKLIYPSHFSGKVRNVTLSGEAYFEVTSNTDCRFVLSLPDQTQVEVLGTKFNVEAYDDLAEINTTLLDGNVHFLYQANGKNKYIDVHPGEKVVYDKASESPKILKTSCLSELAWKDGKVIFDNTLFKDVLKELERRFNVRFIVRNDDFWEYRFTGTFITQQLKQILVNFQISSNIQWHYLRESPENNEKSIIELY